MVPVNFAVGRILMIKYPEYPVLNDAKETKYRVIKDWHPAVLVGDANHIGNPRFRDSLYQIVPATTWQASFDWADKHDLYPVFKARPGGFRNDSIVLLDQLLTVDLNYHLARGIVDRGLRIKPIGSLTQSEMKSLLEKIQSYYRAQNISHLEALPV